MVDKFGLKRWDQRELLMSAALLYPLALKCFLQKHGLYTLTEEDVAYLVGFDALLEGAPFFGSPEEQLKLSPEREKGGWVKTMEEIGMAIGTYRLGRMIGEVIEEKGLNVEADD